MTASPGNSSRRTTAPSGAGGPVVVTVNGGSSSIKFSLAAVDDPAKPIVSGVVERVGTQKASLSVREGGAASSRTRPVAGETLDDSIGVVVEELKARLGDASVLAIGHRIVHGGTELIEHQLITPRVLGALNRARKFDEAHLPREIALIEGFALAFPGVAQVACFDTAFHRGLPLVAQLLPIPRRYFRAGVRRLGFHGLSYTSLMGQLAAIAGDKVARGRVILAHLGSGASMAAVRGGKPMDTTMAFTPTSGLVMATRPGDLDPGVLVHMMGEGLTARQMSDLLSHECGLLGVSELSGDVRDLMALVGSDVRAAEAIELFCAQARKHLCAMAGSMEGVDTIVFGGGVGEHSPAMRTKICRGLEFLGVSLDETRNGGGPGVISADASRVGVFVIATDEESVMVDIVREVVGAAGTGGAGRPTAPNEGGPG